MHPRQFMMLSMEYQRAKINHINYLDILNLLHAIGGSDVFPELILTVKLSIATLTPHQIDLYYKTYTKDGKNCGRRLEEEVRELAQHVRDDEDVKIVRKDTNSISEKMLIQICSGVRLG